MTKSGPANYVIEQQHQWSLGIKQYEAEEVPTMQHPYQILLKLVNFFKS
jgi:hypothetical protein